MKKKERMYEDDERLTGVLSSRFMILVISLAILGLFSTPCRFESNLPPQTALEDSSDWRERDINVWWERNVERESNKQIKKMEGGGG
jgi:hypothetical protein